MQRIAGVPLLPTSDFEARCTIRLLLRRAPTWSGTASVQRLQAEDDDAAAGDDADDYDYEEVDDEDNDSTPAIVISQQTINDVNELPEIVRQLSTAEISESDHEIVVEISAPQYTNLDFEFPPSVDSTTSDHVLTDVINRDKAHKMYIAAFKSVMTYRDTKVITIINAHQLAAKTIAVQTMVDKYEPSLRPEERVDALRRSLQDNAHNIAKWFATSSVLRKNDMQPYERLIALRADEMTLARDMFTGLLEEGKFGVVNVQEHISEQLEQFACKHWHRLIDQQLSDGLRRVLVQYFNLGWPVVTSAAYDHVVDGDAEAEADADAVLSSTRLEVKQILVAHEANKLSNIVMTIHKAVDVTALSGVQTVRMTMMEKLRDWHAHLSALRSKWTDPLLWSTMPDVADIERDLRQQCDAFVNALVQSIDNVSECVKAALLGEEEYDPNDSVMTHVDQWFDLTSFFHSPSTVMASSLSLMHRVLKLRSRFPSLVRVIVSHLNDVAVRTKKQLRKLASRRLRQHIFCIERRFLVEGDDHDHVTYSLRSELESVLDGLLADWCTKIRLFTYDVCPEIRSAQTCSDLFDEESDSTENARKPLRNTLHVILDADADLHQSYDFFASWMYPDTDYTVRDSLNNHVCMCMMVQKDDYDAVVVLR